MPHCVCHRPLVDLWAVTTIIQAVTKKAAVNSFVQFCPGICFSLSWLNTNRQVGASDNGVSVAFGETAKLLPEVVEPSQIPPRRV